MLPALAIEAQLEAQPLPAEQAQAIAQPVIAPVLGGPYAEPRRPTQPAVTPVVSQFDYSAIVRYRTLRRSPICL